MNRTELNNKGFIIALGKQVNVKALITLMLIHLFSLFSSFQKQHVFLEFYIRSCTRKALSVEI